MEQTETLEPKIEILYERGDLIGGFIIVNDIRFIFMNATMGGFNTESGEPLPETIFRGEPLRPRCAIKFVERLGERPAEMAEIYAGLRALRKEYPRSAPLYIEEADGLKKVEEISIH